MERYPAARERGGWVGYHGGDKAPDSAVRRHSDEAGVSGSIPAPTGHSGFNSHQSSAARHHVSVVGGFRLPTKHAPHRNPSPALLQYCMSEHPDAVVRATERIVRATEPSDLDIIRGILQKRNIPFFEETTVHEDHTPMAIKEAKALGHTTLPTEKRTSLEVQPTDGCCCDSVFLMFDDVGRLLGV